MDLLSRKCQRWTQAAAVDVVVVLPGRHLRLGELGHRHQPVAHYPCDEPGGPLKLCDRGGDDPFHPLPAQLLVAGEGLLVEGRAGTRQLQDRCRGYWRSHLLRQSFVATGCPRPNSNSLTCKVADSSVQALGLGYWLTRGRLTTAKVCPAGECGVSLPRATRADACHSASETGWQIDRAWCGYGG